MASVIATSDLLGTDLCLINGCFSRTAIIKEVVNLFDVEYSGQFLSLIC